MTALLDNLDGPLARATNTTSDLGKILDHDLLDPLGAWLSLLGARSAIPEWDLLWCAVVLRSVWPLQDVRLHSITLLPGPVAWVLVMCGLIPLARRIVKGGNRSHSLVWSILWYSLLSYCTVLLLSYPISHEEGVRWDKLIQDIIFG